MKQQLDRTNRTPDVGDWAHVKLQSYRQHSVALKLNQQLEAKFFGPFQVVPKIGYVAYKLNPPKSSKIHPVFHISLLKRHVGNHSVQSA